MEDFFFVLKISSIEAKRDLGMVEFHHSNLRLGQLLEKLEAYSKCPSSLSGKNRGGSVFLI